MQGDAKSMGLDLGFGKGEERICVCSDLCNIKRALFIAVFFHVYTTESKIERPVC